MKQLFRIVRLVEREGATLRAAVNLVSARGGVAGYLVRAGFEGGQAVCESAGNAALLERGKGGRSKIDFDEAGWGIRLFSKKAG